MSNVNAKALETPSPYWTGSFVNFEFCLKILFNGELLYGHVKEFAGTLLMEDLGVINVDLVWIDSHDGT